MFPLDVTQPPPVSHLSSVADMMFSHGACLAPARSINRIAVSATPLESACLWRNLTRTHCGNPARISEKCLITPLLSCVLASGTLMRMDYELRKNKKNIYIYNKKKKKKTYRYKLRAWEKKTKSSRRDVIKNDVTFFFFPFSFTSRLLRLVIPRLVSHKFRLSEWLRFIRI